MKTSHFLPDDAATDKLAQAFAAHAEPGDCFLLRGQIGAGKSAFSRAFIRSLAGSDTEVPSPTFTLVQTYESSKGEIWHADLYRLADLSEIEELGLIEAMGAAICLIEWPELLEGQQPEAALEISFQPEEEGRRINLDGGAEWSKRLDKILAYS